MSDTVRVNNYESVNDALDALSPLTENDTLEDRSLNHDFLIRYEPCDSDWKSAHYGDFNLRVFTPERDPPGGKVIYGERHKAPMTPFSTIDVLPLYNRAKTISHRLQTNENVGECEHCGWLHHDDNTQILSWNPLSDWDWIKTDNPHSDKPQCIGFESLFWPRIHVYTHDKTENPLFDNGELKNCESLTMARGYGHRTLATRSKFNLWMRKGELDHAPDNFRDDIDTETLQTSMEYTTREIDTPDLR